MRRLRLIFFPLILLVNLFLFISCREEKSLLLQNQCPLEIDYKLPLGINNLEVLSESLSFFNVSTGEILEFTSRQSVKIEEGLYHISCQVEGIYSISGTKRKGRFVAKLNDFKVITTPNKKINLSLSLSLVDKKEDFVIEEIFFAGTLHPSGKQYNGDNYIILYNGTDHTLYADGIAFCESEFLSTNLFDYKPDIRHDAVAVQAVYVVPGRGKEYPVKPGGRFILCDTGIDHRTNNPNSFDLSKANFEWYDVSTVPTHHDFDSPLVPNLDKWYCYTFSFFILHKRGYRSYILARVETTKDIFLKDYIYKFSYDHTHNGRTTTVHSQCYKIPNQWVIDGVNLSVESAYKFNVLPENIDLGWTFCGKTDGDKSRFFHSVRRKYLGKEANGNKIFQDTNNSTDDFNPMATPSLVEEQGTAIDAKGTPCKSKTYDGVIPVTE